MLLLVRRNDQEKENSKGRPDGNLLPERNGSGEMYGLWAMR